MQPTPGCRRPLTWACLVPVAALLWPATALAATALPGIAEAPSLPWGIPFAGVLGSIALAPMLAGNAGHRRLRLILIGWCLALLVPEAVAGGFAPAAASLRDAMLDQYLPFISLLIALYTIAGGIVVAGGPWGRPAGNTLLLALGTLAGGVVGTTAAAMVLIHPLLAANAHRTRKKHLVLFFIVLVANAGGALTPIGNPPLYMGFLVGVPFFWPLWQLALPLLLLAAPLLGAFYLFDRHLAASEPAAPPPTPLRLGGVANLGLIGLVAASVAGLGSWHGTVALLGGRMGIGRAASVLLCLAASLVSLAITPQALRRRNKFAWPPMVEVAELFAAIFITIAPVLAMLRAGPAGPFAGVLRLVADAAGQPMPAAYFWLAGLLSSVLDNAPTYLVFFGLAGGNAALLTGPMSRTLVAISTGAVFFGGLTYIGSAPNLLIRAIAAERGVRSPGFFGYCAGATLVLATPLLLVTFVFF